MMTKIKLTRRLLAVMLGLTIAFLACACASVDAPSGESKATEESKATGALELSEVNAEGTSSEAEPSDETSASDEHLSADAESSLSGGITITPIEPTYPEERETTLEKVLSFDIGIDGMFQYRFIYYDDPSVANIELPGDIYCGTDGKFYHYVNNASMRRLICLNDGMYMNIHQGDLRDAAIYGDALYLMTVSGTVYEIDVSDGLKGANPLKEYTVFEEHQNEEYGYFSNIGGDAPIFRSNKNEFFDLEKDLLQGVELPFVLSRGSEMQVDAQINSETSSQWLINRDRADVLLATQEHILLREKGSASGVTVFVTYDKSATPLSRFACSTIYGGDKVACEIAFDHHGGGGVVKEFTTQTFVLDQTVFEGILNNRLFFAPNGTPYLAVYYPDHCDIYRVDAGYTSEELDTFEPKDEQDSIAPTSSAEESLTARAATTE